MEAWNWLRLHYIFNLLQFLSLHQQPSCGVLRRREERSLSKTRLQVLPPTQSLEGLVVIYIVAHMNSFSLECGEHKWTKQLASEKWIEATVQGNSWFAHSLSHSLYIKSSCHLISIFHASAEPLTLTNCSSVSSQYAPTWSRWWAKVPSSKPLSPTRRITPRS